MSRVAHSEPGLPMVMSRVTHSEPGFPMVKPKTVFYTPKKDDKLLRPFHKLKA